LSAIFLKSIRGRARVRGRWWERQRRSSPPSLRVSGGCWDVEVVVVREVAVEVFEAEYVVPSELQLN